MGCRNGYGTGVIEFTNGAGLAMSINDKPSTPKSCIDILVTED